MALEELVYGCTCACVMYVHFFFFFRSFFIYRDCDLFFISVALLLLSRPPQQTHTSPCFLFAFLSTSFFFLFFCLFFPGFFFCLLLFHYSLLTILLLLHLGSLCQEALSSFTFPILLSSFPALERLFVFFFSPYVTLVLDACFSSYALLFLSA